MGWKKIVLGILAVAVAGLVVWGVANRRDLANFPSIISSFYAKQMCSCLFVVGQTETRCRNESRQYVPISGYHIDWDDKAVTVSGLGRTNRAKFVNERLGCVLDPYD